jgi:glutamate--cysteine ligase
VDAHWRQQLRELAEHQPQLLRGIGRGIEKESLRVNRDGTLAQTPHPQALGAALTHASITTDYSEALLEFITPVSRHIDETLDTLDAIHRFVYRHIGDELLWSTSMPCIVAGDAAIPVARYGTSNVGRMKTVYRYGLGHRYGRLMQAIAGVHYNFSMPDEYWAAAHALDGGDGSLEEYVTERYLGLIRNFHRWSWLLIYLFGASPAVCASFMRGRGDHPLLPFDDEGNSLHLPHATSLRMGGLGYNSDAQRSLKVCYNSLDNYLATLSAAILTPHPAYAELNERRDGEYQQLNDGLLQIENEFYSTIRPKRPARSGETALSALRRAGIEYVEVRCLDVNPFLPLGVDATQLRFLDSFLLHCLLVPSPACSAEEQQRQGDNLAAIVNRGREPGLTLSGDNGPRAFHEWAGALLDGIEAAAACLDTAHGTRDYTASVAGQRDKVNDPELTPSARVLREMREKAQPFYRFALRYSQQWAEEFRGRAPSADTLQQLERESRESLAAQRAIEEGDTVDFEHYLAAYYAQYRACQRDSA